jgi:serine/threonine protein kinase
MIGETINQRYEIIAELGQGGMGTVYRAKDATLKRDVAVKVLSNFKIGTDGRARLLHEALALFEQLETPWQLGRTHEALGDLYQAQNIKDKAAESCHRALELFEGMQNRFNSEKVGNKLAAIKTSP